MICFLAGAGIMVIEISASKLLNPIFGNSIYTWTALIGVLLVCISIGGWVGGWLSDKRADFALLGWMLAGSAVLTLFIPAMAEFVLPAQGTNVGLIAGPLVSAVMLFALPGILLGAISPTALRLYSLLGKDAQVGRAAGMISMLGSLGSFVGTFLSGFYLLSHYGVRSIFIGSGILLLVLAGAAFYLARYKLSQLLPVGASGVIALISGLTAGESVLADVVHQEESFYHQISVVEKGQGAFASRFLQLDNTQEGGISMKDGDVVLNYQQFWRLPAMNPEFKMNRALFIGAGAFGMPCRVSREYPSAHVDVAELDPKVIEIGKSYFNLGDYPNVKAHAGDARRYLRNSGKEERWDFIFGDAYNGIRAIPSHLASKEFFQLVSDHLSPQGVFLMNVITAVEGPRAELLSGMVSTLGEVFPHVEIFAVDGGGPFAQNVMLLASHKPWKSYFTDTLYASGSWQQQLTMRYLPYTRWPGKGAIFTDDLNPVDAIIARSLAQ
jgi:spermidine synthase